MSSGALTQGLAGHRPGSAPLRSGGHLQHTTYLSCSAQFCSRALTTQAPAEWKSSFSQSTEQWHWAAPGSWHRHSVAGTVTGAAVSSQPSATSLSWCQLLNLPSRKRKGLLKSANAVVFTVLSSGMSSLLFQGLNQVTSTNTSISICSLQQSSPFKHSISSKALRCILWKVLF